MGFWKRLRCKLCCGFKISLNDEDGDGIPDRIIIEPEKKIYDNI